MALDARTAQAQLTPEERRGLLRAFADRMLLKITAMDDPEDMPGVERAVRVAAVIERVYSRCDRAERQVRTEAPALFKAQADCANHQIEAIRGRVSLAGTLEWEDKRRRALGSWWDAAEKATQSTTLGPRSESQTPAAAVHISAASDKQPAQPTHTPISTALRSHKSGDATPAPNLATTDLEITDSQVRSGASLRSSAPDWPP